MRTIVAVLLLALGLTACDAAQQTLEEQLGTGLDDLRARADGLLQQGRDLATTFEWCTGAAQLAQAVVAGDVEKARAEAEALRGDAPEELGADLRVIAEAAARAQVGDPRQLMEDDVQQSALNVYAYAVDLCGLSSGGA